MTLLSTRTLVLEIGLQSSSLSFVSSEVCRKKNNVCPQSIYPKNSGKPHPRWADSNFRDGDPNEKWHSRATKCLPAQKRGSQPQSPQQPQQNGQHTTDGGGNVSTNGTGGDPRNGVSTRGMQSLLSPIKSEPMTDTNNNAHLYRFSPSPAPSMRYHSFQQGDVRAGADSQTQSGFPTTNGASTNGYHHSTNSTGSHYSGNLIIGDTVIHRSDICLIQKMEQVVPTPTMAKVEPLAIIIFVIVPVGRALLWV